MGAAALVFDVGLIRHEATNGLADHGLIVDEQHAV
jgi:hypothetical protein